MLRYEIEAIKLKLKDMKWKLKVGEYDEVIVIGLGLIVTYIVVGITVLMMKG